MSSSRFFKAMFHPIKISAFSSQLTQKNFNLKKPSARKLPLNYYSSKPLIESFVLEDEESSDKKQANEPTNSLSIKDLNWFSSKLGQTQKDNKALKKPKKLEHNSKRFAKREKDVNSFKKNSKTIEAEEIHLEKPAWKIRKEAVTNKLNGERWNPEKKVSRAAMERIRFLARELPDQWTVEKLSLDFKLSYEAVRRILKSKYEPTEIRLEQQENKRKESRLQFLEQLKKEELKKMATTLDSAKANDDKGPKYENNRNMFGKKAFVNRNQSPSKEKNRQ